MEYDDDVERLALKEHAQEALTALMAAGSAAAPAVRRGLLHDDPIVRVRCCMVLDHNMDDAAVPELIANLEHPEGRVRAWALHALACDRCKEGECRPGEEDVIPLALRMLKEDRSRKVRSMAVSMLAPAAVRRPEVAQALADARDRDPHPVVRTVASWYAPGGRNYRKLAALNASAAS